ncbi:unnamed protein product [Discula destructiva]
MLTPVETITLEWFCCAVALALVLGRFWVRITLHQYQHHGSKLWLSDLLLVAGMACAFGTSTCDTLTFKLGAQEDFSDPSQSLAQIRFAEKFLFDTGLYFPKLSLLLSFEMMVPKTSPRLRLFLWCIAIYLVLAGVVATGATAFWCGLQPSTNWLHPQQCSSFTNSHLQKVTWTLNIVGELLLFIFPFTILKGLRFTEFRDKLGLALVFSLGMVTIVVTSGRFLYMCLFVNDIALYVWTTAEISISVMVVATMAFAPLLRKVGVTITSNCKKLKAMKATPKWRLRLVREDQLLPSQQPRHNRIHVYRPSGDVVDELPMPKPTAMWHKWPVDLDVTSMSVTTLTTTTEAASTQRTTVSSTTRSTSTGGRSTRSRSIWDSRRTVTRVREDEELVWPEMVSRGTQTLGRVMVELDPDGLPYGARFGE